MTARTRPDMKSEAAAKVDTTGAGGTSGQDVIDLMGDLADSAVFPGDAVDALAETADAKVMTGAERAKLAGLAPPPSGESFVSSPSPLRVVVLTQAAYDALGTPDAATLYVING